MDKVQGKTRKRHPLQDSFNESKLFPNTHPSTPGSKYAKAVELPDPDLEPLEPEDDDQKPPPSETAKGIGTKLKERKLNIRVRGGNVESKSPSGEGGEKWGTTNTPGGYTSAGHHIAHLEQVTQMQEGSPEALEDKKSKLTFLKKQGHQASPQHYSDLSDHWKSEQSRIKRISETNVNANAAAAGRSVAMDHGRRKMFHSDRIQQSSPGTQQGIYRSLSSGGVVTKSQQATAMLRVLSKASPAKPDLTGELEGKFKVSVGEMISQLNKIITAEYSQWMRWYHYSLVLRGHCRDALAGHFVDHAGEELEHAEAVAMRVIGLGGYPATAMEHPEPLRDAEEIIKELIRREQDGMQLYRKVHALCGDNEGTRQVLEANMGQEQEHIDDLWRFLKHPDMIKGDLAQKANMSSGEFTQKPEKQSHAAYSHSFARDTDGISGAPTPDLPERGRDWHGTVPGVPDEPEATSPEEEKEQEEAQEYFKPPPNPLKKPKLQLPQPQPQPQMQAAQKALAGAPRFAQGPVMAPRAVSFLLEHGFSRDEIAAGEANMTPRMRGEYNRDLLSQVRKSLSRITPRRD